MTRNGGGGGDGGDGGDGIHIGIGKRSRSDNRGIFAIRKVVGRIDGIAAVRRSWLMLQVVEWRECAYWFNRGRVHCVAVEQWPWL